MIQKININWENCYGIKLLKHEFLFGKSHSHLIYAPNGTMKTSFAKTMKFLSGQTKEKPQDLLPNEAYWTSSEKDHWQAYGISLARGRLQSFSKNEAKKLLPIRTF